MVLNGDVQPCPDISSSRNLDFLSIAFLMLQPEPQSDEDQSESVQLSDADQSGECQSLESELPISPIGLPMSSGRGNFGK